MKNIWSSTILMLLAAVLLFCSTGCNRADAGGNKLKSGVGDGEGKACAT